MDRTKVVSATTMNADTFFKHVKMRHPGLLQLYPHLPELRIVHGEEHELDERKSHNAPLHGYSFTHYHE